MRTRRGVYMAVASIPLCSAKRRFSIEATPKRNARRRKSVKVAVSWWPFLAHMRWPPPLPLHLIAQGYVAVFQSERVNSEHSNDVVYYNQADAANG